MKKIIYLLLGILVLVSCQKEELIIDEIIQNTDEVIEQIDDSVNENTEEPADETNYNVPFNEYGVRVHRDTVRYSPQEWDKIGMSYYKSQSNFHFYNNGEEYFLHSSDGPNSPSILLKRTDTIWGIQDVNSSDIIWGNRNFEIVNESEFVFAGTGEVPDLRPNHLDWKDYIWIGKFNNGVVEYSKITNTPNYYHSISVGDLTDDGLYDVFSSGIVFVQRNDGTFEEQNYGKETFTGHTLLNPDRLQELQNPHQSQTVDLYSGGRNEIIVGFIDVSDMVSEDEVVPRGDVIIYEYSESTNRYEVVYELPRRIVGRVTSANDIEVSDLNGDGLNDIMIEVTGYNNSVTGTWIEIWMGNSDKSFTKSDEIFLSEGSIHTTQFSVIDVNNDGSDDIVLRPWRGGDDFIENWCQDDCFEKEQQGIEVRSGIKLENLIYLNDGNGKFNKPNFEIRVTGTITEWLKPFMRNGNLCFFGTQEHYGHGEYWDVEFVDIEIDKSIF